MDVDEWDAIVIGSGLGGLSTAAYLTTNGHRTLVLEQADRAGGCSHVFRRKRVWEFEVGVHYVGDVLPGGAVNLVLRGLGLDNRIEYAPMDRDGFDTVVLPGLTFKVPASWDQYLARLIETFPDEEKGLRRCVRILRRVGLEVFSVSPPSTLLEFLKVAPKTRTMIRWGARSMDRLFDACRLGPRARAVIMGQCGAYAVPPSRATVTQHSAFMHTFLNQGAFYPKGGGQVFAGHLLDVVESHGGALRTRARVERIMVEGGHVTGVQLAGGERLYAPVVVSNADVKRTYLELVGREHLRARTVDRIENYRMASPLCVVYLGLDTDLSEWMPNTNYWVHQGVDLEEPYRDVAEGRAPSRPWVFISSSSIKDPASPHGAPPGHSNLEVIGVVPADYQFWGLRAGPAGGASYRREAEYQAAKQRMTQVLIDQVEQFFPGISEHIVYQEAATPITQERYTLASGGAGYGIEVATDQIGRARPAARTEIGGLYLTGSGQVWGGGVASTLSSGLGTASTILNRDLRKEVLAGRVFADTGLLTAGGPGWDPLRACQPSARTSTDSERQPSSA